MKFLDQAKVYIRSGAGGNGCIAIFMSANHDDGICGGKETAFKSQVCPGKPGTN